MRIRIDMRYIDVTPTWTQILPAILLILEEGTENGRKSALAELYRMAKLADKFVALQKEASEPQPNFDKR